MNLKKYLSVGHVVEDMNHLHGRYHHSRPGMIPRFEARTMGSVRSTGGARGSRHIIFSSKASGAHEVVSFTEERQLSRTQNVAQGSGDSSSGEHLATPRASHRSRGVRGVFKRNHSSQATVGTEEGAQQDLFEKIIPIGSVDHRHHRFSVEIQKAVRLPAAGSELPQRGRSSWWPRLKRQLSAWLRKG